MASCLILHTSILNPSTFHIHVNQAIACKGIKVLTTIQLTEWSFHEHACHVYVFLNQHMHYSAEHNWAYQDSFLLIAFIGTILMYWSALAHISHVRISCHSKWPHLDMGSCWTLSKHQPACSHTLHSCHPSYSPQRLLNPIHFEWFANGQTRPLQVQLGWCTCIQHHRNPKTPDVNWELKNLYATFFLLPCC
jgi:hypothetical protein